MEPYAVIKTGGKQYRVKVSDTLKVERINADVGEEFEIQSVLAVSDGDKLKLGMPEIEDAKVVSVVKKHIRGDKVISFKRKRRKGYAKKKGHRQELTVLEIEKISS